MTKVNSPKQANLYQYVLAGGLIVLLAYATTYLLAVSPMVVRVVGPLFGG